MAFLILGIISQNFAQQISKRDKQSDIWYFGNGAGLDFRSGKHKAIFDGRLFTEEGSATIATKEGDLLFYTNGVTVWDNKHRPLPNGFDLHGGISTTQSATIVPKPGSERLYYLFTVDEKAGSKGLTFSVIDIEGEAMPEDVRLKNTQLIAPEHKGDRKGSIIQKNQSLLAPVSEKLIVARHSNGRDYWVICHKWNSDAFYAFPLSHEGVDLPVISRAGSLHIDAGSGHRGESIGYLKLSSDGRKLASAICYLPDNEVEVFDFDPATGRVSNVIKIPTAGYAYGLEFSPDNSKLYVSFLKGKAGVMQYDLTSENAGASGIPVAFIRGDDVFASLQLGPDGKIYVARAAPWLDIIAYPNSRGKACDYRARAVNLAPRSSVYGLPNIVYYHQASQKNKKSDCEGNLPLVNLGNDTSLYCLSDFVLNAGNIGSKYQWSTGDTTMTIAIKESGIYWVEVQKNNCRNRDTIKLELKERPAEFSYLPVFRPENKGFNNVFEYSIQNVQNFELKVFNQSDKLVFKTSDPAQRWKGEAKNGKSAPAGEYKWLLEYQSMCTGKEWIKKEGMVTLIR